MKFHPHGVGRDRQTVTFSKVKERIVMKIQKEYDYGRDTADSIREMKVVDLSSHRPSIQEARATDPAERAREEKALDVVFQKKMEIYLKREETLEENLAKAYSLIYENYCDTIMQIRVKEHPDFQTTILNDPIKLLEAIAKLMHEPIRAHFGYISMMEAHRRLLCTRQREKESLLDYMERFKQEKSIVKSHMGENFLDHFVEQTKEYKEHVINGEMSKAVLLQGRAYETYTTAIFMSNADKGKYGDLMDGFSTQYSLGNDQYPRTLQGAVDVMRKQRKKSDVKNDKESNNVGTGTNNETKETSFAQSVKRCYCCGSTEHLANNCPERSGKPRSEWYDRKGATQHHQQTEHNNNDTDTDTTKSNRDGWSGFQQATVHTQREMKEHDMRDVLMLDSGTTISLFCNPDLVTDVRDSKEVLSLTTNAGLKIIDKEATVNGFGTVHFDKESIANIFGLQDLVERYQVTMDSKKENAFLVHTTNGIVRFKANGKGLYIYEPTDRYLSEVKEKKKGETSHLQTVRENRKGFTQREYDRALQARKLMHIVGAPTVDNFKSMLRQNIIVNCPITTQDVTNAEKIFGKDVSSLKGKSTRPRPTTVINDYVDIPRDIVENNSEVELCMDIMFINELPFLTTIDRQIKF